MSAANDDGDEAVQMSRTLSLSPDLDAPGLARSFVRDNCRGLPETVIDDACLLTSEVVTNALVHAGTPITVAVGRAGDGVEVAVCDDGAATKLRPRPLSESLDWEAGRGLGIVDYVAAEWGVHPAAGGKAVWFRLP